MNYQDAKNLKKGDQIIFEGVPGEITGKGYKCGERALWFKHRDRHGKLTETLIIVCCWKEHAWYNFGKHRRVQWQNELAEEISMQNANFGER